MDRAISFKVVKAAERWIVKSAAVQIVLAEAIGVSVVSLIYLAFFYGTLRRGIMALDEWVVASSRRLWLFVAVLFLLPALLLTSGIWIGPIAR